MKKNLLIVGAGGHGRCCLDIARENGEYQKISFLDDSSVGSKVNEAEVIDTIANMDKLSDEYQVVFVAVGNNRLREELMDKARTIGFDLESLISSKSTVSSYARLGKGVVIFPNAVIEANAKIGTGCIVAANATINHDATLEAYTLVNSNSVIRPNVVVKTGAMVGSHCVITFGQLVNENEKVPDGTVR